MNDTNVQALAGTVKKGVDAHKLVSISLAMKNGLTTARKTPGTEPDPIRTKREMAERLRRSERTLDRLCKRGCPHIKTGKDVLFPEYECLDWFRRKFGRNLA